MNPASAEGEEHASRIAEAAPFSRRKKNCIDNETNTFEVSCSYYGGI